MNRREFLIATASSPAISLPEVAACLPEGSIAEDIILQEDFPDAVTLRKLFDIIKATPRLVTIIDENGVEDTVELS